MIRIVEGAVKPGSDPMFDAMYRDRKRVFVDLRKWNVPVIGGEFEVDQFDGPRAIYCIATDERGAHRGSIRLLPTDGPHILGSIFPELCDGDVPRGPDIRELTRACPSLTLPTAERLKVRNALISAVVEYARHCRIRTYTCVADSGWLSQILAMGWHCSPLGLPRKVERTNTGALRIDITPQTRGLLHESGTWVPSRLVLLDDAALAHC